MYQHVGAILPSQKAVAPNVPEPFHFASKQRHVPTFLSPPVVDDGDKDRLCVLRDALQDEVIVFLTLRPLQYRCLLNVQF